MSIFSEIVESGFDIYKFLNQRANSKDVIRRVIYRELRNNIQRLEHRNRKNADKYIIIQKLENTGIVQAINAGFSFNKLAPRQRVDEQLISRLPSANRYRSWDAEKLVLSIDEKIVALKDLFDLYHGDSKSDVNLTLRLNNLFILCIALTLLIKRAAG